MAFFNPEMMKKIFGDPSDEQGYKDRWNTIGQIGAGITQGSSGNGATFAQGLAGGVQGMQQGQQQNMAMAQARQQQALQAAEIERRKRLSSLFSPQRPDFASQVATGGIMPGQGGGAVASPMGGPQGQISASPMGGSIQPMGAPPSQDAWARMFPDMMGRAIKQESGGRQFGADGGPLTSPAGAIGIAQIMPKTGPDAAELAGEEWDEDRYRNDRDYNLKLGTAYMNHMGGLFNDDPVLASAAYNWGQGNLRKLIDKVGDPSKGEISHEDFIAKIPSGETRNYARTVGMPALQQGGGGGGGGQQQQQMAAQQQPMNGYQRNQMARQQQSFGANMPPEVRQLLATLDPDVAGEFMLKQMTQGPAELPADVQSAMWAAGGDEQRAREIYNAQQEQDGMTGSTQSKWQTVEAIMAANPEYDRDAVIQHVFGATSASRDSLTGDWGVNDAITGLPAGTPVAPPERPAPPDDVSTVDASRAFGAGAVWDNFVNTAFDMFGREVPREDVEDAITRVKSLGIQGDVLLSEQFSGRVSNQLLDMIGELKAKPTSVFQGPSRGKTRFEEMRRLVERDLERNKYLALDPTQSTKTQGVARLAQEKLTQYQAELDGILDAWGSSTQSAGAGEEFSPDQQALIDRWAN